MQRGEVEYQEILLSTDQSLASLQSIDSPIPRQIALLSLLQVTAGTQPWNRGRVTKFSIAHPRNSSLFDFVIFIMHEAFRILLRYIGH